MGAITWTRGTVKRWILFATCVAAATCLVDCSGAKSASRATAMGLSNPSVPGLLVVGPQGLVLMPNQTAQLSAQLVDSYGNPQPAPASLTWVSTDPTVLSVSSTGLVTAIAVGTAAVTVTDGVHGTQTATIDVATDVPTGAVAVQFTPPVVQLAVGAMVNETFVVTGPDGTPVMPPPQITFQSLSPSVATMATTGAVQGTSVGFATMVAFLSGATVPLAGNLPVLVSSRPTSSSGSTSGGSSGGGSADAGTAGGGSSGSSSGNAQPARCDPTQYSIVGCAITNGGDPFVMNKPGLTYPVTVQVYWTQSDPSCAAPIHGYMQQGAPDTLGFTTAGVASYDPSTGLITSTAPGATTFHPSVSGVECEGSWDGNPLRVGADIGGSWSVSGTNGDEGSVTVPSLTGKVKPGATWGGGTGVIATPLSGTSCVSNSSDMFSCDGTGSAYSSGGTGDEEQLCTEARPCTGGAQFTTCAPGSRSGTDGSVVYTNDHIGFGNYQFRRGGSACAAGGGGAGSCDGTYTFTFPAATNSELCATPIPGWSGTIVVSANMATITVLGPPGPTTIMNAVVQPSSGCFVAPSQAIATSQDGCPSMSVDDLSWTLGSGTCYGVEYADTGSADDCASECSGAIAIGTVTKQ